MAIHLQKRAARQRGPLPTVPKNQTNCNNIDLESRAGILFKKNPAAENDFTSGSNGSRLESKKGKIMKKFALSLSLVLALGGNAMAGWHCGWGFWPSFSVGVGLGGVIGCSLGAGLGCCCYCGSGYPAYGYAYSRPSYAYAYAPAASYVDPPPAAIASPAWAPEPSYWVPSTPGAGRWVPDPAPYSYTPGVSVARPAETKTALRQVVSVGTSPEGIPVYSISYSK